MQRREPGIDGADVGVEGGEVTAHFVAWIFDLTGTFTHPAALAQGRFWHGTADFRAAAISSGIGGSTDVHARPPDRQLLTRSGHHLLRRYYEHHEINKRTGRSEAVVGLGLQP
jgi:hypothetical protein